MRVGKRGIATLAIVAGTCGGCGQSQPGSGSPSHNARTSLPNSPSLHAHPQPIEPVAGAGFPNGAGSGGAAQVSVGSSPGALAQPASDTQIRQELAASGLSANPRQATLTPAGLAIAPVDAPAAVQQVIAAGNAIAHLPYRFGGGHGTFEDSAYDCSGSLSFVFAAAGILKTTVTSGQLMGWGSPGSGKWITVFATNGHTFMYVAGLRFDTVALAETGSRWSNRPANEPDLRNFVARHPVGL